MTEYCVSSHGLQIYSIHGVRSKGNYKRSKLRSFKRIRLTDMMSFVFVIILSGVSSGCWSRVLIVHLDMIPQNKSISESIVFDYCHIHDIKQIRYLVVVFAVTDEGTMSHTIHIHILIDVELCKMF